ncbi:MAG: response regulator [Candidatus Firestonebacteria bacterium]
MIKNILLVDDDSDFTDAVKNFLEAANYNIEVENKDENAIAHIKTSRPDLVLLDVLMTKETSGFEIAEKMNSDENLNKIPVIFLTAYFKRTGFTDKEEEIIKKWKNVKYILDKPVKPSILLGVIQKL